MKIRFLLYGLIGLCLEVFWTGLGSFILGDITLKSQTSIWMFLIYGLGIFLEPVHERLRGKPVFIRGGVYTFIIYFIELFTGLTLRLLLGVCPWNYKNLPLSFLGIVTLSYIPVWFFAGLFFELIHDSLIKLGVFRSAVKE